MCYQKAALLRLRSDWVYKILYIHKPEKSTDFGAEFINYLARQNNLLSCIIVVEEKQIDKLICFS